jgi:hypothetical protein
VAILQPLSDAHNTQVLLHYGCKYRGVVTREAILMQSIEYINKDRPAMTNPPWDRNEQICFG